jgi:hypothetical protein
MAQVVTNENMLEFIQNRQVPEFKAPDAKVEPAKPSEAAAAKSADSATASAPEPAKAEQPRAEDGKFVKDESKIRWTEPAKAEEPAAKTADDDEHDDDGAKLSDAVKRKIDKIVAKKHRAMKEAEEFARDEYRERKAAVERAEALQREIDALKAGKSVQGTASSEGDEPKPEDFRTVGEYAKALTKWEVAQARKAESAEAAKQTQKQQIEAVQQQFAQRVAETAKTIPDYHEVVEAADWEVPHHIQAYIVDSENGARLGYHLAKNRDEFDRIAKLSPIRAFAELGKLEDKLTAKAPAKEPAPAPQVSRAPAPITPLEGKSTTVAKDPSQMTFQELRAHRQAERAAGKYR